MGAEETENHSETIQIFIQNMLQLIRRGYGRNECFGSMVKKLLKVCKYSQVLVQIMVQDNQTDLLTDRKTIQEIIVAYIQESENINEFIGTLFALSSQSIIGLMAVNELLEAKEKKTVSVAQISNVSVALLQSQYRNELYDEQILQYIHIMSSLLKKNPHPDYYLIIHQALTTLADNFIKIKPQMVDSLSQQLLLTLFQLDNQFVVTPPLQTLHKILPISYISAPYLAVYMPELYVCHHNVQAQIVSWAFILLKYGFG